MDAKVPVTMARAELPTAAYICQCPALRFSTSLHGRSVAKWASRRRSRSDFRAFPILRTLNRDYVPKFGSVASTSVTRRLRDIEHPTEFPKTRLGPCHQTVRHICPVPFPRFCPAWAAAQHNTLQHAGCNSEVDTHNLRSLVSGSQINGAGFRTHDG
jgi:hypothetical protein